MRIVTLIENMVYGQGLVSEHGLSFYVEDGNSKILLDTGQSGSFMQNAERLNISMEEIDAVVISHGHYDHTGGLYHFLERNNKAMVYVKNSLFDLKFNGENRFIGTPFKEKPLHGRLKYVNTVTSLSEHVFIMPEIPLYHPDDTHFGSYNIKQESNFLPDRFEDELYLAIKKNDQVSLITSCSHRGITNICEQTIRYFNLPVNLILGGFHTINSTTGQMENLLDYFHKIKPLLIGVSHCTGIEKFALLSHHLEASVFYNSTGKEIYL